MPAFIFNDFTACVPETPAIEAVPKQPKISDRVALRPVVQMPV
jgi:hypothetical protein